MHQVAQQTVEKNSKLREERVKSEVNYKLFADV